MERIVRLRMTLNSGNRQRRWAHHVPGALHRREEGTGHAEISRKGIAARVISVLTLTRLISRRRPQ